MSAIIPAGVPSGAVMHYGGSTAPPGWLEMAGQSTAGYASLAAIYGANLPDCRGEFIRGYDNGRGVDSGRAILSSQTDQNKAHTHTFPERTVVTQGETIANAPRVTTNYGTNTTDSSGGTEARPRNIALMVIVKI